MFVRYADNVLRDGKLAWNPGGEAVYGLTAPLFLAVVIPMRLVFPAAPALAAQASSLLCGFVFVLLLAALVKRCAEPDSAGRFVIALLVLCPTLLLDRMIVTHFLSGMDTTFALAALTAFLLLAVRAENKADRLRGRSCSALIGGVIVSRSPRPRRVLHWRAGRRRRVLPRRQRNAAIVDRGVDRGGSHRFSKCSVPGTSLARLFLCRSLPSASARMAHGSGRYIASSVSDNWPATLLGHADAVHASVGVSGRRRPPVVASVRPRSRRDCWRRRSCSSPSTSSAYNR